MNKSVARSSYYKPQSVSQKAMSERADSCYYAPYLPAVYTKGQRNLRTSCHRALRETTIDTCRHSQEVKKLSLFCPVGANSRKRSSLDCQMQEEGGQGCLPKATSLPFRGECAHRALQTDRTRGRGKNALRVSHNGRPRVPDPDAPESA